MQEAVIAPLQDAPSAGRARVAVLVDVDVAGARIAVSHPAIVGATEPRLVPHPAVDLLRPPLCTRAVRALGIDEPIAARRSHDEGDSVGPGPRIALHPRRVPHRADWRFVERDQLARIGATEERSADLRLL